MTCWECGCLGPLHQHHVVPRSRGGTRTLPLCERCHGLVHDRDLRIGALTRRSMRSMRDRGLYTGGDAPYGMQPGSDGRLVEHPGEQAVIVEIRRLRDAGLSYRKIVAELDRAGFRSRGGGRFRLATLTTVLGAAANDPPPCRAPRAPAPPRASEPGLPAPATPATR